MEEEYFAAYCRLYPLFGTVEGHHTADDSCGNPHSAESWKQARRLRERAWSRIEAVQKPWPLQTILFADMLECTELMEAPSVRNSLLVQPQSNLCLDLVEVLAVHQPLATATDRQRCLQRILSAPTALRTYFEAIRKVLPRASSGRRSSPSSGRAGIPPCKAVMEQFLDSLESTARKPPYASRLAAHPELQHAARLHVERVLLHFVQDARATLLPRCPLHGKARHLSSAVYRACIRYHTSLKRQTPDQLHARGLSEVARLEAELRMHRPHANRAHVPRGDILEAYRRAVRHANRSEAMTREFGTLRPSKPCRVLSMPDFRAQTAPLGYYEGDTESAPPAFYVNTRVPHHLQRGVDALAFHEAVPGHHFQIQISEDFAGKTPKPPTCKLCNHVGFEEGWAVYAESVLGIGDKTGILESELFRACRLVVDTGLHAYGWTQARAVQYMRQHAPGLSEQEIQSEVLRYLADPGQALAYTVGLHVFRKLRPRNPEDVVRWHRKVLTQGSRPLWLLLEEHDTLPTKKTRSRNSR